MPKRRLVIGVTPSPKYVKDWVRKHQLTGEFAMLTQRFPANDPNGNHRMEIINL